MIELREGDIYRWEYNVQYIKDNSLSASAGTLYWCCSQIGIVTSCHTPDGMQLKLMDTYWGTDNNKSFSKEYVDMHMDLRYIANIDELEQVDETARFYYADKDCVDLNHANSSKGNFYIRKGAVEDVDKQKRIMERSIKSIKQEIQSELNTIEYLEKCIQEGKYFAPSDTNYSDNHYLDYEE